MRVTKWRLLTCILIPLLSLLHRCEAFFSSFTIKRDESSNSCYYNGGRHQCTFFLFCALAGGNSVGTCPGSILSTCCVMHQANDVRRSPPTPSPSSYASSFNQRVMRKDKVVCGQRVYKPQSRIVGGNDAQFGEFPWQAHIKIIQQQCGGVLLNHYYVVTAAHCVYRALLRDMIVVLGAYDIQDQSYQLLPAQRFRVVEKKLHPSFRFSPSHPDRYDVALLKLDRQAIYQENVLPICLPPYGWNFQGWNAIITGWGKTDPALSNRYGTRLLQKVEVPIISNKECEMWHQWKGINVRIYPEMMCAGYEGGRKDACVGDSGGPLIVQLNGRWTLVGIISAGFGCAQWRQPGIYHSVSTTVDWIGNNISKWPGHKEPEDSELRIQLADLRQEREKKYPIKPCSEFLHVPGIFRFHALQMDYGLKFHPMDCDLSITCTFFTKGRVRIDGEITASTARDRTQEQQ